MKSKRLIVTLRIIFGTCLFPIVTLWQRHSISIYLASWKAQATTCKRVNTYDNGNLQENTGAKLHDTFPIGHPALPQFLILNVTSSVKRKASCKRVGSVSGPAMHVRSRQQVGTTHTHTLTVHPLQNIQHTHMTRTETYKWTRKHSEFSG